MPVDINLDRVINIVLAASAVGVGYILINSKIKQSKSTNASAQLFDNVHVQMATRLRSAFNPSGMSWLMSTDGTSNAEIFAIAKQIKDFKAVTKAYSDLYKGDNLTDDLRKELSSAEFNRFLSLVQTKSSAVAPSGVAVPLNVSSCLNVTPPAPRYKFNGNDLLLPGGTKASIYSKSASGTTFKKIGDVPSGTVIGKVVGRMNINKVSKECKVTSQQLWYKVETPRTATTPSATVYVYENDVIKR